ncbi:filamentous hemagglutinin N-terminal domain-containing protein [Oscillatoria sp. CS-180]|uniref:two-partner secretion domain-containing protein n=1 Tax=Oscillatoria sp. CS-180 TaxID=3021720 RepID=UPI00232E6F0F|nr:filamentous hemagglutinin N-terminal domain-containing protein [Oscillatoria sp. CS-180]MDB9527529.1 filamentous hemagglutinin N-terminal domain-containing protein [Oscillatoria sp. CS-180]
MVSFVSLSCRCNRSQSRWVRAIALGGLSAVTFQSWSSTAIAQVQPDTTLGPEQSTIIEAPERLRLEGGAARGTVLFHSFSDFNVAAGQQVYFANPDSITDILMRVTGDQASGIFGTLGVEGAANLTLINPNGILFGETAELDLVGSFAATTADSVWVEDYLFSAVQPEAPPLLTLSVVPGIQFGANSRDRTIDNRAALTVGDQQSLILQGGTLNNTGILTAPGGQIALTGDVVNTPGTLRTASSDGNGGAVTVSALGETTLGSVDSRGLRGIGGDIDVTSQNRSMTVNGNLQTDGNEQAGNMTLVAPGQIAIDGDLTADAVGPAGDITLQAGEDLALRSPEPLFSRGNLRSQGSVSGAISLSSGGTLSADSFHVRGRTSGDGIGGDIRLNARRIELDQSVVSNLTRDESQLLLGFEQNGVGGSVVVEAVEDIILQDSGLFANADYGTADSGDLTLNAQRLEMRRDPDFTFPFLGGFGLATVADLESTGNTGDLQVTVTDSIRLTGPFPGPFTPTLEEIQILIDVSQGLFLGSPIYTIAFGGGNSGDLTLQTGQLILEDGGGVATSAFFGSGGELRVEADAITLRGLASIGTGTSAFGESAGNLDIRANHLTLTDGAAIATSSLGAGQAGNLSLTVQQLNVFEGSAISTATFGRGDAGRLTVDASDQVTILGTNADGSFASAIAANSYGEGNAATLDITTDQLVVQDGGRILTTTSGSGAGADIRLDVNTLQLDQGQINASSTTGQRGGDIQIQARDSVELVGDGSNRAIQQVVAPDFGDALTIEDSFQGILTISTNDGAAGSIQITTPQMVARNGALVSTTTFDQGTGGDIDIMSNTLQLDNAFLATGTFGNAASGNITLQTRQLQASGGSQAITTTFGLGQAGNLTVIASESIDLIDPSDTGIASGLFASSFQVATGSGGDISVATGDFRILDGATVTVSGEGEGDAGNVDIAARSLLLDRGFVTATSASGEGGNLNFQIDDLLLLRNGSLISTTAGLAGAGGNGGNITFSDGFIVAIPEEDSDITADAFEGRGGNVSIATEGLFGIEFRDRLTPLSDITASSRFGLDGEVTIELFNPDLQIADLELPTLTPTEALIMARCAAPANDDSTFVVTGRGGLPTDPRQTLSGQVIVQDWRRSTSEPSSVTSNPLPAAGAATETMPETLVIVEAQGWQTDEDGNLWLTAEANQSAISTVDCDNLSAWAE